MKFRHLFLLSVMGSLAYADEMKIVGFSVTTTGSFSSGTPTDLSFAGSEFSGTSDSDGFLRLSDLGTFTLAMPKKGSDTYHQKTDTFILDLTFVAPLGVVGETVFDAKLKGKVKREEGSVFINFGPTHSYTFANATGSGGFDLTIDDLTLSLSSDGEYSHALSGSITNAFDPPAIPEPQSVILFGTAILLAGSAYRRVRARRS